MKKIKTVFILMLLFVIIGCQSAMHIDQECQNWINSNAGSPGMDITGTWKNTNWGDAILKQQGNSVSGYLGDYSVTGSIDGKMMFIGIYYGQSLYYSAILELVEKNILRGEYYNYMKQNSGRIIVLRKKE